MADVTGRTYEAFTEFLLRKLNYRDEWTEGNSPQYFYEKHPKALCHENKGICKNSYECHEFSKANGIPFGPWYDPDFFIMRNNLPLAALHVSHWSNPMASQLKFWRTIEDHFQYKINFGRNFLSINLVFVALDTNEVPTLVKDSKEIIKLQGWKPAVGSAFAVSFDSSILFPVNYYPLEQFEKLLPKKIPSLSRKKRELFNSIWETLYKENEIIKKSVKKLVTILNNALTSNPNQRYTKESIHKLQDVCWNGRKKTINIHHTFSRYRKGIQHAFIIRELISIKFNNKIDPDIALWSILKESHRFKSENFSKLFGDTKKLSDKELEDFRIDLSCLPVKMDKRKPIFLLKHNSGIGHSEWNDDLSQFIRGLKHINNDDLKVFIKSLKQIYKKYNKAYGINYTLLDLSHKERVNKKINYVYENFIPVEDKDIFLSSFLKNMPQPGLICPHSTVVKDVHNWVLELILEIYELGSMQHISTQLPRKFENSYGHSLNPYCYMNSSGPLISQLLRGVSVGKYFSKKVEFSELEFYKKIWPLIGECIWEAIQDLQPLEFETIKFKYLYKKALRIISSPDLEPISLLLHESFPKMEKGPNLYGVFSQFCKLREWSNVALRTETTGKDSSGVIIHSQAVIGGNGGQIGHKTRELAARLRSINIKCDENGKFLQNNNSGMHFLVLDGDWPIENKINLFEAGFSGIFEIAELNQLKKEIHKINIDKKQ